MRKRTMKPGFATALALAGCLAAGLHAHAQAPASGNGAESGQNAPAGGGQKPTAGQPAAGAQAPAASPSQANPFPEDTGNVPVMPSKGEPALPEGADDGSAAGRATLPGEDSDPVHSPDDATSTASSGTDQGSSSSWAGMDKLLPGPDDDRQGKKGKRDVAEPDHVETPAEDIEVGKYYLDTKNWKAALSRFQSAMVLDPDNPEVFWGLAETERHLGDFADARKYYQTVVNYDPDSRHGKDAVKALKEPEIANAKATASAQPAAGSMQK